MSNELKVAIEAVKAGAKKALEHFENIPPVEMKADNTPVTIADKETEEVIKKSILSSFPNAKIVGEETGGDVNDDEYWIIDPIDGTKLFIRGIKVWAVLLALIRQNEVVLGVSYIPGMDELLYAEKGEGAFLNGKKVHVSTVPKLKDALICFTDLSGVTRNNLLPLIDASFSARGIGDAFSYHLVTNGRADLFTEPSPSLWDIAPFQCIIKEAGGKFTSYDNNEPLAKAPVLASNHLIHDEAIAILNGK